MCKNTKSARTTNEIRKADNAIIHNSHRGYNFQEKKINIQIGRM